MKKYRKRKMTLYIIIGIIGVLTVGTLLFTNQKDFGRLPTGDRKARMEKSWHYKDGEWKNELPTTQVTGNYVAAMWDFLFGKHPNLRPKQPIKAIKTDVKALSRDLDLIVWFGHSSYLLQLSGKRILVDPVFVQSSPVSFANRPFKGTDIYKPEDMPAVDYMIITHDHWEHLDYKTQMQMKARIGEVIVPLGIGEDFEYWGFEPKHITDLDWYESKEFNDGFVFHCMPARHFSGRGLKTNQTLWGSFVIEAPDGKKVYVGGDSGYSTHFKKIGEMYPDINLAILENGQYDKTWAQIHTMPNQLAKEMKELGAKHYITVHHSKFALGNHPWNEPLSNEKEAARESGAHLSVLTIGQVQEIE